MPALEMHTKLPNLTDLPHDLRIVRTYERIQQAFPGSQTPAVVVVQAPDVETPAMRHAYELFRQHALATGELFAPFTVTVNPDHTVARIDFAIGGNGDNAASVRALETLRDRVIPPIARTLPDTVVAVTGTTAGTYDFNHQMRARLPYVFLFVLGLAFSLLLLTFRSIVIAATAVVLNLLSVGAAYGILAAVFQRGWLAGPLGFQTNGAVVSWLPLFLFVVLFGLSMDYHVFILSRIKELHDAGETTDDAIRLGITRTAGTVTSAAVIMVAVMSARCAGSPRSARASASSSSATKARIGGSRPNRRRRCLSGSSAPAPIRGYRGRYRKATISSTSRRSYAWARGKLRTHEPSVAMRSPTGSGSTSAGTAADATSARARIGGGVVRVE